MAAPEPSLSGGGIQSHWTCGNARALPSWEAESGIVGLVVARGCTPHSLPLLEPCM
jgi:hypothetical protein